jgi:DNA-binding beta-propeller fold protein YncE
MLSIAVVLSFASALVAQKPPQYRVAQHYKLGGDDRWDYITYDPEGNRLFISRSTHVMVVDAASGKVIGDIPDTPGVHGIEVVPSAGRGFITAGRAGQVVAFDLKTLKKVGEVKAGENPDAIMYDAASGRVLSMNGRSKDITFIDPASLKAVGTVALGGAPEVAVSGDPGQVFVNLEDTSEIVALDSKNMKATGRWKLTGCEEPTGLAFDPATHRLFSACPGTKTMAVSDSVAHKVITTVPIGGGSDGLLYDPATHYIITSNGEGSLTVIQQKSADKYEVVQTLPTARGARTSALDPKSHNIYLITAQFGPAPAPTADQPRPRPPMFPGTFEVIVCELQK